MTSTEVGRLGVRISFAVTERGTTETIISQTLHDYLTRLASNSTETVTQNGSGSAIIGPAEDDSSAGWNVPDTIDIGEGRPYPSGYSWQHIVLASIVVTVIMLAIVLGNGLVVLAIIVDRNLKGLQNWFIASLAVSDLLVGLFIMPLSLANELMGYWHFGEFVCEFWLSTDVLLCTASILNLCLISLDRYWSITRAIAYIKQRTKTRAAIMISVVWVLSMVICLPPLVGWKRPQPTKFGYPLCFLSEEPGYIIYSSLGSFYFPLIVMILVYLKIYFAAKKRARKNLTKKVISTPGLQANGKTPIIPSTIPNTASSSSQSGKSPSVKNDASQLKFIRQRSSLSMLPAGCLENVCTPPCNDYCGSKLANAMKDVDHHGYDLEVFEKPQESEQGKISRQINREVLRSASLQRRSARFSDDAASSNGSSSGGSRKAKTSTGSDANRRQEAVDMIRTSHDENNQIPLLEDYLSPAEGDIEPELGAKQNKFHDFENSSNSSSQVHISPCRAVVLESRQISKTLVTPPQRSSCVSTASNLPPGHKYQRRSISKPSRRRSSERSGADLHHPTQFDPEKNKRKIARARERRATLVLGIVMASFIGCWLPFFSIYPVTALMGVQVPNGLFAFIFWLGYCNSALNPIIYTIFNREFRHAFHQIIFGRRRCGR